MSGFFRDIHNLIYSISGKMIFGLLKSSPQAGWALTFCIAKKVSKNARRTNVAFAILDEIG